MSEGGQAKSKDGSGLSAERIQDGSVRNLISTFASTGYSTAQRRKARFIWRSKLCRRPAGSMLLIKLVH